MPFRTGRYEKIFPWGNQREHLSIVQAEKEKNSGLLSFILSFPPECIPIPATIKSKLNYMIKWS